LLAFSIIKAGYELTPPQPYELEPPLDVLLEDLSALLLSDGANSFSFVSQSGFVFNGLTFQTQALLLYRGNDHLLLKDLLSGGVLPPVQKVAQHPLLVLEVD